MKRQFVITILICFSVLIAEKAKAQGGFGGVHVNSEFTSHGNLLMIGGGGAWVINPNFYIGGAGYGNANSLATPNGAFNSLGYGGLMLGYFSELKEDFRLGGDVLAGSGGYSIDEVSEGFYFIEPNIKAWYSIMESMHLSVGIYYRIAYLNADSIMNPNDLNNLGVKLSLNFGGL